MVQYCRKCGQELDDDAEFCDSCGFNLNSNPANNQEENTTDKSKPPVVSNDKKEFVTKLPLILSALHSIAFSNFFSSLIFAAITLYPKSFASATKSENTFSFIFSLNSDVLILTSVIGSSANSSRDS